MKSMNERRDSESSMQPVVATDIMPVHVSSQKSTLSMQTLRRESSEIPDTSIDLNFDHEDQLSIERDPADNDLRKDDNMYFQSRYSFLRLFCAKDKVK